MQTRKIYAFDVMGTLLNVSSLEDRVSKITKETEKFLNLWRRKQLEYSWLNTIMEHPMGFWRTTERALQYSLEFSGIEASDTDFDYLMDGWLHLEPYPEVHEALDEISLRRVALTNADREMAKDMLANAGLSDKLERTFTADKVGKYKPYQKVYHQVPMFYGVKYAEVYLISSNAWDVAGAIGAGLGAIYVNRGTVPQETIGMSRAREIRDLLELVPE